MVNTQSQSVNMLAVLINDAASGKKVSLKTKFLSEVIAVERGGRAVDTNVLSVEYSGRVDGKSFKIKKNYLFADDSVRHPLECILIANNRLQLDYNRLKKAGIALKENFFTLENSFKKLPGDSPIKRPALTPGLHSTLPGWGPGIGRTDP